MACCLHRVPPRRRARLGGSALLAAPHAVPMASSAPVRAWGDDWALRTAPSHSVLRLVQRLLEGLGGLELRYARGLKCHLHPGLWVARLAFGTLGDLEGAEARNA